VLGSFVRGYAQGAPELGTAMTPEQRARCRLICHSLRGACASIGALALVQALAAFEADLARPGDGTALSARGLQLHQQLVQLAQQLAAQLA
jgi:HPt (histidine-containing phosphotransfer) domain-containing protein